MNLTLQSGTDHLEGSGREGNSTIPTFLRTVGTRDQLAPLLLPDTVLQQRSPPVDPADGDLRSRTLDRLFQHEFDDFPAQAMPLTPPDSAEQLGGLVASAEGSWAATGVGGGIVGMVATLCVGCALYPEREQGGC